MNDDLTHYVSGTLAFSFDSGTAPAVKQMRLKLLMSNAGSMNLELDEVGSNLTSNVEMLNTFLELYDVGKVKQKLTKNTSDNKRGEEFIGKTPTNLMLFGTPTKLLDGSKTEEELRLLINKGIRSAEKLVFLEEIRDKTDYIKKRIEELNQDLENAKIAREHLAQRGLVI